MLQLMMRKSVGSTSDLDASSAIADEVEHELLTTSPPAVDVAQAQAVAVRYYGDAIACKPLSGERDRNFCIERKTGECFTLKFINAAETEGEVDMQVEVLKHLAPHCPIPVPFHISPIDAGTQSWVNWMSPEGVAVRVRAYSFLTGSSGAELATTDQAYRAVGVAAGELDKALADFHHPAADREFLWDTARVPALLAWLDVIDEPSRREQVGGFLRQFEQRKARHASALPVQIIHNDLSPSNFLSSPNGDAIAGILDFGDMVYTPRVAEVAIAASYQMATSKDPLHTLSSMLDGYSSVLTLSAVEREHAFDLVLARLAQRLIITAKRAQQFPTNRHYILRSRDAATQLFDRIIAAWQAGVRL